MKYIMFEPDGELLGLIETENGRDSVRKAFKDFCNTPNMGLQPGSVPDRVYMDKFFADRGITRLEFKLLDIQPEDMLSDRDLAIAADHGISPLMAFEILKQETS